MAKKIDEKTNEKTGPQKTSDEPKTGGGGGGGIDGEAAPRKPDETITLQSRFRTYTVQDVQFREHTAHVTPEQFAKLSRLAEFGQGADFWQAVSTANVKAAG